MTNTFAQGEMKMVALLGGAILAAIFVGGAGLGYIVSAIFDCIVDDDE